MYIKSKKEPDKILHIIHRLWNVKNGRVDYVDPDQFIQFATSCEDCGKAFKPHTHKHLERNTNTTQEVWIVISGAIRIKLYDVDEQFIQTYVLKMGDVLITLAGGHSYEVLYDNTIVYEVKTGPYYGQEKDKKFITENN